MLKTLKELCALPGVSSAEDAVRDYIQRRTEKTADAVRVDAMGNLIVFKKGAKTAQNRLMLAAHMDEVGLIVHAITDEGYLKFYTVGGIDRRVLLGKRVCVGAKEITGVIGLKAFHLVGKKELGTVPKLSDFYIDIGAENGEQAKELVSIGDVAVFSGDVLEFGEGMLKVKALDDRIGCAVMLHLLEKPLPMDCTFVFTVQEEVGTRGAFGAAFSVKPEIALVLEGTTAADLPSMDAHKKVCIPGKGPVIPFMDGATIYDRGLFELLRDAAEKNEIPWQTKHFVSGGTDAGTIQRSREGVRVAGISAAVRYLHTPSSVVSIQDYENMLRLSEAFIHAVSEFE